MSLESLVLDSQGFSGWIDRDRKVMRLLEQAEREGADLAMPAATIIEVSTRRGYGSADVAAVPDPRGSGDQGKPRHSAGLLKAARLHGHKYAMPS